MAYRATVRIPLPEGLDVETVETVARGANLPWPWKIGGVNFRSTKAGDFLELEIESMDTGIPTEADFQALENRVPDALEEAFNRHLDAFSKFKVAVHVCKEKIEKKLQEIAQKKKEKEKKGGK